MSHNNQLYMLNNKNEIKTHAFEIQKPDFYYVKGLSQYI